jgi:glutathione S-transferase
MTKLTLYTNPQSRARIARWMIEEVGEPYEAKVVAYGPEMKTPEYLALNPMGKVPALVHGKAVVTEVAAICAYLAAAFPKAGLEPKPGTPEHATYLRWLFFAAGPVEAAVTNRALGFEVPPDRQGMVGYGSYDRTIDTLEAAVAKGPYIVGKKFTAADVYVGAQIGWGLQFKSIPERAAFSDYWARLKDRPALARADAASNAELPKEG